MFRGIWRRLAGDRRAAALTSVGIVAVVTLGTEGFFLATSQQAAPAADTPKPPAVTASPTAPPLASPFTGEPVTRLNRVLAVKIGNTVPERPATGLSQADIVYLLPVEGGLSRIMAIYSTAFPPVVGPVRSARQDDIQLLRQFGKPAFVWSGAQPELQPVVENSRVVDLYAGIVDGYFRSASRPPPYNLYGRVSQLLAESQGASVARDIGFRFGAPPAGGKPTHSFAVSYPATAFRFTWSAAEQGWRVSMDGEPATSSGPGGGRLTPPTVVIQDTDVTTSPYKEEGVRPPYAASVGSGRVTVLRDGMAFQGRWSRPSSGAGTTFTTDSGQPLTFSRGQVWVVFTDAASWTTAYPGMG